jgi:ferritin-like protein
MSEKSEKDKKAFQSYLDNIKAKTGKTPEDFRKLAKQKGLVKSREIVAWLKEEYGLGYGHAGAIYYMIVYTDDVKASTEDRIEKLFAGKKVKWRKAYDALEERVCKFGTDVQVAPNMTQNK